jgi:hypothetical protein
MSLQLKAFLFSALIYMIVFFIVLEMSAFFFKEESFLILLITAIIASLITPRFKKVKMQSGDKHFITNDLFHLFRKKD